MSVCLSVCPVRAPILFIVFSLVYVLRIQLLAAIISINVCIVFCRVVVKSLDVETSSLLARDAFVRTNRRAIGMMFVRLSVCPSAMCGMVVRGGSGFDSRSLNSTAS